MESSKTSSKSNFLSKFTDTKLRALKRLTSQQFFEVWNNYDQDGNGYIEGGELENFLREFVSSISDEQDPIDEALLGELKRAFMDAYDNNRDGRIDIRELAQLLPIEESFKLVFNFENQVASSVDFMRIWTKYDTDSSGYIDSNELKSFLRDLLHRQQQLKDQKRGSSAGSGSAVSEDKLDEYTETLLKIFDANKDGKLQLNEMTKLLLVKENFLHCFGIFSKSCKKLDKQTIERIFASYDTDGNGVIENEELKGFIKDLMDFLGKVPETSELNEFERVVMEGCDANGDGKINKKELTTVLLALAKHAAEEDQKSKSKE